MNKVEELRESIARTRSAAERLNSLADDMEASLCRLAAEVTAAKTGKAIGIEEVRKALAEKCVEGFAAQVRALIESYGASSLKEIPGEKYGELLEAAGKLGAGPEVDADAG